MAGFSGKSGVLSKHMGFGLTFYRQLGWFELVAESTRGSYWVQNLR